MRHDPLRGRRALALTLWLSACASSPHATDRADVVVARRTAVDERVPVVRAWPEASAPFHGKGPWLGADSAYSVDLGPEAVLWLFGDTFLDPLADGSRENGPNFFVRNSVAIQSGSDPASAHDLTHSTLTFHWGPTQNGAPSSFFHDFDGAERFIWPLHGARLPDGRVLLFRMQVVHASEGLGFRVDGWDAVAIDDPQQAPEQWQPRAISAKQTHFNKVVGASVLVQGAHLYAYAFDNDDQKHTVYLARWPLANLVGLNSGALDAPQWFTRAGFVAQGELSGSELAPLFEGQTEFSVHHAPELGSYLEIQMQGLFVTDPNTQVAYRSAPQPEGPWSELRALYRPVEYRLPNPNDLAAYAAKAHPEQRGAAQLITYVVNDLKRLPPRDQVYYPQTLALSFGPTNDR
jgi:hypothetical protein